MTNSMKYMKARFTNYNVFKLKKFIKLTINTYTDNSI